MMRAYRTMSCLLFAGQVSLSACGAAPSSQVDASVLDAGLDELDASREDGARDGASAVDSAVNVPDSGSVCPALGTRSIVRVPAGVLADDLLHWTCDNIYLLEGIVLVHSADPERPQQLLVDAGTVIRGATAASERGFLVVTRNGHIEASGTPVDPIVFTSNAPIGSRARDDWGGVTLLGRASTGGTRDTEGFPSASADPALAPYLDYGALDGGADDDAWDCGTLRYVRVEFASFDAGGAGGNESNALQLYACGWNTEIEYVQTHMSGDDGVEIFGGTVDMRHLVLTRASDDGFDYDDGWSGRAQFVVVQQDPDAADFGIEAGGSGESPTRPPTAQLYNFTLVGTNGGMAGGVGARLRGASRGTLRNFIVLGFTRGYLDIGGAAAAANLRAEPALLSVRHSVFYRAGAGAQWPSGSDDAADGDLVEADFFMLPSQANRVLDPMLADPFTLGRPNFIPASGAALGADFAETPAELEGDARPAFFDASARYIGAFEPGGDDWTAGWTTFVSD